MPLIDGIMLPNRYEIEVDFDQKNGDSYQEWVAFERMKYFFNEAVDGCIFAHRDNPSVPRLHKDLKTHIMTFAEEPLDMVVGLTFLSKLIFIAEDRLSLLGLRISSSLGDNVVNHIDAEDILETDFLLDKKIKSLTNNDPWWFRSDAGCTDLILQTKKKVTVKHDKVEWESIDLGWIPSEQKLDELGGPLLTYPRGNVGWKPKIIEGGKS